MRMGGVVMTLWELLTKSQTINIITNSNWWAPSTTYWLHQILAVGVNWSIQYICPKFQANHHTESAPWASLTFIEAESLEHLPLHKTKAKCYQQTRYSELYMSNNRWTYQWDCWVCNNRVLQQIKTWTTNMRKIYKSWLYAPSRTVKSTSGRPMQVSGQWIRWCVKSNWFHYLSIQHNGQGTPYDWQPDQTVLMGLKCSKIAFPEKSLLLGV
jgi:hypothetical protein